MLMEFWALEMGSQIAYLCCGSFGTFRRRCDMEWNHPHSTNYLSESHYRHTFLFEDCKLFLCPFDSRTFRCSIQKGGKLDTDFLLLNDG